MQKLYNKLVIYVFLHAHTLTYTLMFEEIYLFRNVIDYLIKVHRIFYQI